MDKEIRTREIQFITDNNIISGQPIVFNSISEILWDSDKKRRFREIISPEALSQEFIDTQDIMLNLNHDREKVLARRKPCGRGSMDIQYSEEGVSFSTECPNTQLGRDTYTMIQRGEYTAMSFAYYESQDKGSITWDFKTADGIPTRTVHKIDKLVDIAIVYNPAFTQTSVSARSIEDLEAQIKAEIEEVKPIEELKEESGVPTEEPKPKENRDQDNSYLSSIQYYEEILAAL